MFALALPLLPTLSCIVSNSGPAITVDIFRLDHSGKIIEHRDVLQTVPGTSAHKNMFLEPVAQF
jgi:predicted SnoaL-like aldol condensation-catalyzing enzyme